MAPIDPPGDPEDRGSVRDLDPAVHDLDGALMHGHLDAPLDRLDHCGDHRHLHPVAPGTGPSNTGERDG